MLANAGERERRRTAFPFSRKGGSGFGGSRKTLTRAAAVVSCRARNFHPLDRDFRAGGVDDLRIRRQRCGPRAHFNFGSPSRCDSVRMLSHPIEHVLRPGRTDFTRKVKPMVMHLSLLILQMGGGAQTSIPALVAHASPFSKGVLLLLLVLSVYSWAVIWNRWQLYAQVEKQDRAFLSAFRGLGESADCRLIADQHPASVLARTSLAGLKTMDKLASANVTQASRWELAQRSMDRAATDQVALLERHVGFLATVGSVAPFIGLMGTVWGVMVAFVNIGAQGSATLAVVAPGIAEALIATIAGLAAAIPSVIGYNHCLGRLRDFGNSAASFTSEFLDRRLGGHLS